MLRFHRAGLCPDARCCDPRQVATLRSSRTAPASIGTRRCAPNVGRNDFDFENTTHFACPQQPRLTFDCTSPVASARRCGLLIWLWHRPNPVHCCELLILHRPCAGGAALVKSSERMHLTEGHEGHASWKEPGHSYRSNSSYRKLPPPACPGTTCKDYILNVYRNKQEQHACCL